MRYATVHGFFSIKAMPNQPSIAWCSDFTIHAKYRGEGKAHTLKAYQNDVLRICGFAFAMCSVKESNAAQVRVLSKAGWNYTMSFNDVRTGEPVQIWTYRVEQGR